MRLLRWLMPMCWLVAGCHYFDHPGILVDPPNGSVTNLAPRIPANSSARLTDRDAVGMCLPKGVRLTMTIEPPGREPLFNVEQRLAELGARRAPDGTLVDGRGKLLYDLPPGVPFSDKPLTPPELMHVNQPEVKRFLEAILSAETVEQWLRQNRPLQPIWSPQKGEFDRLVLSGMNAPGTASIPGLPVR